MGITYETDRQGNLSDLCYQLSAANARLSFALDGALNDGDSRSSEGALQVVGEVVNFLAALAEEAERLAALHSHSYPLASFLYPELVKVCDNATPDDAPDGGKYVREAYVNAAVATALAGGVKAVDAVERYKHITQLWDNLRKTSYQAADGDEPARESESTTGDTVTAKQGIAS